MSGVNSLPPTPDNTMYAKSLIDGVSTVMAVKRKVSGPEANNETLLSQVRSDVGQSVR